ncbi:unnamed protein product [Orchesella dallaii]|uniref:Uncharacterized protein n=1 Tax=Orchesella dallaii TaxID=48710 RepID=A0ABP1PRC7_9HEXA
MLDIFCLLLSLWTSSLLHFHALLDSLLICMFYSDLVNEERNVEEKAINHQSTNETDVSSTFSRKQEMDKQDTRKQRKDERSRRRSKIKAEVFHCRPFEVGMADVQERIARRPGGKEKQQQLDDGRGLNRNRFSSDF